MLNSFQQLQQHLQRWQHDIPQAAFLVKEMGQRLVERLDLIKLKPQTILDCSHVFSQHAPALHQYFPTAKILSVNMNPKIFSMSKWWQPWQWQETGILADAPHLPFADESIDFVFSNSLLLNTTDLKKIIQEWSRVLKPEGLLLFASLGPDTLKEWRQAKTLMEPAIQLPKLIDMHDIGDVLLQLGFADPVMDMEMLTLYYRHMHNLVQDLRIYNLPATRLIQYQPKTYWAKIEKIYQNYQNSTGHLPVTCELIFGHAWKKPRLSKEAAGIFSIPIHTIKKM